MCYRWGELTLEDGVEDALPAGWRMLKKEGDDGKTGGRKVKKYSEWQNPPK